MKNLTRAEQVKERDYYGVDTYTAKLHIESLELHIECVQEAGRRYLGIQSEFLFPHDDSKWSPAEFPGYANHLHGLGSPDEFAAAWLHHTHFNDHHWQYWLFSDGFTPKDSNVVNGCIEMPFDCTLEMVADWMGSEKANKDSWDMAEWLTKNIPRIKVHPRTADRLVATLDALGYADIVYGVVEFGSGLKNNE